MKNITAGVVVSCYKKHLDPASGFKIISVKDYRIGICDSIKHKIIQPFFTTKPTGNGTGLGLSLSYDMVAKGYAGQIELDSTEGVGLEFIVKLPILN